MRGHEQQISGTQLQQIQEEKPPPKQLDPQANSGLESDEKRASSVPVWMQRMLAIIFVLVCFELGVMLVLLPWKELWTQNSLVASYPNLHLWLDRPFVRGIVSGLGAVDLWIGISAAVHYRDRR